MQVGDTREELNNACSNARDIQIANINGLLCLQLCMRVEIIILTNRKNLSIQRAHLMRYFKICYTSHVELEREREYGNDF